MVLLFGYQFCLKASINDARATNAFSRSWSNSERREVANL
jgi:hypothetical protein